MQSPQEPNPLSPEIAEQMQFLLSRQLDGDLASEDSLELAKIQQSESLDRYLADIHKIRQHLTSLRVKPVPPAFLASIRQAILEDSAKSRAAAFAGTYRGWRRRLVVSATIAACVLGLAVMLRPGGLDESNRGTLEIAPVPAIYDPAATFDTAPANSHVNLDSSEQTDSSVDSSLTQQEELRPFLDSDDWRIVVVQVNSKDRDEVMRDIEAIVARNDMNIRTVVEHDDAHDNRFGVLLTSAGVDEEDFINSVVPQADAKSTDWNAQNVAESSRESLISRLQESLKTPTYSELHFGQVYVTLPKRTGSIDVADRKMAARSVIPGETAMPGPVAKKNAGSPGDTATNVLPEPRKPVLVVFEFTDPSKDHI